MALNLSNYSLNAFEGGTNVFEIKAQTLISDFVLQINNKIILALFLFGISYFLSLVVLPRSILGIDYIKKLFNIPVLDVIFIHFNKLLSFLIGLFETICLGCCIFVLYIAWIQNLLCPYMKIVIFGILGILILIFLLKAYSYIKNKRYIEIEQKLSKIEVLNDGN